MRHDMGKCVIERPRRGSSERSAKVREFGAIVNTEDGPEYLGLNRIPASRKAYYLLYGDAKEFTDALGPITNYLRSACGRQWDDVYSEIRKTLGHCGWAVEHIITDHINVAVNTWRGVSGKVYVDHKYGVNEVGGFLSKFYVEPETGILLDGSSYKHWYDGRTGRPIIRSKPSPKPQTEVPIAEGREYTLINGVWYETAFEMVERVFMEKNWDNKEKPVKRTVKEWHRQKRQLSKKNLRDLGLTAGRGYLAPAPKVFTKRKKAETVRFERTVRFRTAV